MTIWKTPISLEELMERGANTMASCLGIIFTDVGDNFLTATMPVDDRTRQPLGIMHGGASCVLAETVGSTAANYAVDQKEYFCVGLSIYTQHLRSVREGNVTGVATALHLGRSTQVWNIDITNVDQQLISTTRLTMAVLNRK